MENCYKISKDKELSMVLGEAQDANQIFKLMNRMKSIFTRYSLSCVAVLAVLFMMSAQVVSAQCSTASITTQPSDAFACENASVSFSVNTYYTDAFQWQVNDGMGWVDVPGGIDSTLTISGVTLAMDGYEYRVIASGCAGDDISNVVSLSVYANPSALASTTLNATCNGYPNGSAQVLASGGAGGYTYAWSPYGGTGSTAIGLSAGTYTIVVTDLNGCKDTAQTTVTHPAPFNVSSSQTNVSCYGGSDGTATVNVSGSTAPYTYSWSNGNLTATATNLSAENVYVLITDSAGCQTSQNFTITQPTALSVGGTQSNVTCNGDDDGSISLIVSGGTPAYSYSWTPNVGNTATVNDLAAGAYTVIVTDLKGCKDTASFNLTQPVVMSLTSSQLNVPCYGGSDGEATVIPNGGTGPYTYSWSNGQTSQTAVNLTAGNYAVEVTDFNNCSDSLFVTITEPAAPLEITSLSQIDIPCPGGSSGSISINAATGGTPGYTYEWSPAGLNGDGTTTVTDLVAGSYSVVVTDLNGCTDTLSFTVVDIDTVPPTLITQSITAYVNSFGTVAIVADQIDNGSYDACGIASKSISPNFYTCDSIGTRQVLFTATDNNGNEASTLVTIIISDNQAPTISAPSDTTIYTDLGFCEVSLVSIGTPVVMDNCSTTVVNDAPAILPFGTTLVTWTVTDAAGNTASDTQLVTVADNENPDAIAQDITVYLDAAGTVSITAAQVDNGSSDPCGIDSIGVSPNTFTCANVGANVVTLTVVDVNGNVSTANATVTVVDNILPTVSTQDITVYLDALGEVSITPAQIDNGSDDNCGINTLALSQTDFTCANIGTNTVTLIVTDLNGNVDSSFATVTVVDTIAPTVVTQNITVYLDAAGNASITGAMVNNGSDDACGILTLSVNPNTFTCNDIGPNNVTLEVTDVNGNIASGIAVVTVADTTLPYINCPQDVTVGNDVGLCYATGVVLGTPTVLDSCGIDILTLTNDAPVNFPVGNTNVTWSISDFNGNTNTCVQVVTVDDIELPSIVCQNDTVLCGSQVVNFATPAATDNCGVPVITLFNGLPSGSVFPVGITTNIFVATDASGNTDTCSFNVIINPVPVAYAANQELCHNATTNAISFGGIDTVYNWVNNDPSIGLAASGTGDIAAFTAINTGLSAVTATITVTPEYTNAGVTCTGAPFDFTITVNPNPSTSVSHTDATCSGFTDGTATVIASDGTPGYTYLWSNGDTADAISGLGAGVYYVTVTDIKGCTATDSVEVLEPVIMSNAPSQVNVSCFAGNDGSATANISGGTAPYTYLWAPGGQTTATAVNLKAGNYSLTVTDSNGCILNDNYTITEPTLISLSPSSNNVSCYGGNDGSATVVASGGTPSVVNGYTYNWVPSGGNAATASGLSAGNYTVTVTDSLGCESTQLFIITEPAQLSSTTSFIEPLCNGNSNGSAEVTPAGGTAPYTYLWNNGETNSSISGIAAGTYTVEITDAKNCTITDTVIVTQPDVLVALDNGQTNVSCFGGSDGTATVDVDGGVSPYSYNWSPIGGTAATGVGLSAGTYTVTVTDINGCIDSLSFTITEPTLLVASYDAQTNVSCFGGSDGSATVVATGGTPSVVNGYTYNWAPSGGTAATASGLTAGNYTVTVTDSLGCTDTLTFFITEPTQLTLTDNGQTNVSCFGGSDGTATVAVTGGTAPYAYNWSPSGGTDSVGTNFSAGTYMVTVTDSKGCVDSLSFTITEPALLEALDAGQTNLLCFGDTNGVATVSETGGTAPYTYLWSNGQTNATATGLAAGTYWAAVIDSKGCTDTLSFTIIEPAQLFAGMVMDPVTCYGGNNGSAGSLPVGGVGPYTYLWSNGSTAPAITNLFAGHYSVEVTDMNGCSVVDTIEVTQPAQFVLTGTSTNVSCFGGNDGSASISVSGSTPPYSYLWSNGETTPTITGLTAGIYTVTVKDTNGCSIQQNYNITEPAQLVSTSSQINVSCNGGNDGEASVVISGGVSPYVYLWSTGATSSSISGLTSGTYTVEATDINGCSVIDTIIVTEPTPVAVDLVSVTNVSCNGLADGSLTVTGVGGTPGYSYMWSTGDNTSTISGLTAGTYKVTVFDSFNCAVVDSFVVTEPTILTVSVSQTKKDCAGDDAGEATAVAAGGTAPYQYIWSDLQNTSVAIGLSESWYSVTVIDTNGCIVTDSVYIEEHPVYTGLVQQAEICDGDTIFFGGNPYTTAGLHPHIFQTINGCDSTVTLDLIVNPVYAGHTQTNTICQGDTLVFGGIGYTTAGIYPHTFQTVSGCDSTVTLYLFVNPGSYPVYNVTACDSFTFNGTVYTASGTHVFNHTNVYGCDSIETLILTINPSYSTTQNSAICQGDTITFGNTIYTVPGSYTHTFQSIGGCDSVVTMNLVVNPVYVGHVENKVICQGDSVVFGGTAYYTSGSYTHTFSSISTCDSTVTLNLIVNPTYSGLTQIESICDGDVFNFGGVDYSVAGLHPHTFQTVNGCDSTVVLDLTVNPVYSGLLDHVSICQGDSYDFNGTLYSTAGFYTETFQTVNGCDSTVTLHLTVNPLSVSLFTVDACDSYDFNGVVYNTSGVHTQTYQNIFNCDSTVTLYLTISPSYTGIVINESICSGSEYTFGGMAYNATGIYTHTFNAVNGCDSTVTLNLTVNPTYSGLTQNSAICDGDFIVFGGATYTDAGIYPHTFQTVDGCDSVVTLNLTINPVYAGGVQVENICAGQTFHFGGVDYDSTGLYTHTFQSSLGCDSTVTLDLTVNPVYAGGIQNSVICQGSSIDFGGTLYAASGIYTHTFQTVNGCDSTVTLNLTVNPNTVNTFTVNACDSYDFNGQQYLTSGVYTQHYTNVYNCDSTVILNLTITPSYTGIVENVTICQGSFYTFGSTAYNTTGSYTHTFQTVSGCDSTVTLNLTVNPSYNSGIQHTTICDNESVSFGGTSYNVAGSYTHTFQSVNGCDSTVTLVLSVNPTYAGGVQYETICQGGSVVFGGTSYTATGIYTHTFQTVNGCDSTVTLDLTVNPTYAGIIVDTAICQGESITFGGVLYTNAGVYTHTFQTVNGCDSTVTMHLTVNPLTVSSFSVTACDSYDFNGTHYIASGSYTHVFTNSFGCDSTVTLNLTITPSYTGVENVTICQGSSYNFGGIPYSAAGSYPHTFNTVNGCDSVVTLILTVSPSYSGNVEEVVICQGQSVMFGGVSYNTTGLYPHTFQTVNGCDSIVTLKLTVNPTYTGGVQNETICQGGSVIFGGVAYNTTGSYTHTFSTTNGCDSTVTLNLTVNPTYTGIIQNTTICQGSSVVFGGTSYSTSGVYTHTFQTVNGCDSTVTMNLTVKPNSSVTVNVSSCTPYVFNGITYNASGTYTQSYTNVFGCDSTVTLNLTINSGYAGGVQDETICQGSFFTFGGVAYNTTGSYTHTFQSVSGCDSVVTLNLTVNPSYSGGVETVVLCQGESITFGGTVYNTTGIHTHTFQTVNGCDSTVTLALTVNPTYAGGVQNETICQGGSVIFGGVAYNTTGSYTHTFQTMNGCDSVVTLNLTVNPTYVHTQNSIICEGSSITFGGTAYSLAGSYTHVFQTVNGCDSVVTMNLSLLPNSATSLTASACVSYTLNGQTYNASGVYTQSFNNANGCDSIVTLNLTIYQPTSYTITATACGSYTINGQTYIQSGTYTQSFINSNGCDSTLVLDLTINHVNVGVTQNGNVLTADLANAASYQWINCETGMPIVGDTTQSLIVKVNGTYAVVINDGTCVDTSACITVNNVGINGMSIVEANVFPNPNEGDFTIQLGATFPEINVELYDMRGKLIMRRQFYHTDVMYISEALASGVYQVRVNAGDQNWVKTIIRK